MRYLVNDTWLSYEAKGEKAFGEADILLAHAVDLTAGRPWSQKGFTVAPLFTPHVFQDFQQQTYGILISCWRAAGLKPGPNFQLDQYHTLITAQEGHLAAIDKTKLLFTSAFPAGIGNLEERMSSLCGERLRAKNPFDNQSVFHFRVVRPQSRDNNPLHRDVWLEDYADCINLYIPVAGSNELSSLILLTGSHYWPESRIEKTVSGCTLNGVKFNVPAVTAIEGEYFIERPNPASNEVLIFSPYLVHGGAVNLNQDKTRISIELRLWKY